LISLPVGIGCWQVAQYLVFSGMTNIFYQAKLTNMFLKKDKGQGMNKKGILE